MILGSNKQPTVPDSAVSHFLYVLPRWKMQHFPAGCSFEICLVPSNKQGDQGIYKEQGKKNKFFYLETVTLMSLKHLPANKKIKA